MHGKNNWYNYLYSKRELSVWKMKLEKLEVEKIYIFFNNDVHAHAVRNALTLKEIFWSGNQLNGKSMQKCYGLMT